MNLDPTSALEFLRERAETRLRQVTPDVGPRLDQLHGLGEARQICEDLIADIHAAQAGEIPWTTVDRGLLMVGAPGTGKTTLARALAKECGIKFIAASAAGWQASGALDSHLRAMRADFAEARRYAPAILFIDEIDGIGSREALDDRNAAYQTGVIDALLEQIQGIATTEPVIVVGATNYPDKVDPALRRAGRLDQIVEIPLPNVTGLEQIFNHHLDPYREADQLDADVELHTLAQLSVGLTGADIEFFVRGAFRRARRDHRTKITQGDLLAEVTRRPRNPENSTRLDVEDMRRVAVHEAGHALARLLSSTQGHDITFVTIVPRTDGSLGFVATVPDDSPIETRRTLLERLETVLAGRAAEEIVYGSDDIGAGAGGSEAASDLGIATQLATFIICQSGLGDDGALRWTETPTAQQGTQIDQLLSSTYTRIRKRLETERPMLEQIVAVLEEHQEVSGHDLRELLGTG
jgi:ATP-dependent Zn protease